MGLLDDDRGSIPVILELNVGRRVDQRQAAGGLPEAARAVRSLCSRRREGQVVSKVRPAGTMSNSPCREPHARRYANGPLATGVTKSVPATPGCRLLPEPDVPVGHDLERDIARIVIGDIGAVMHQPGVLCVPHVAEAVAQEGALDLL